MTILNPLHRGQFVKVCGKDHHAADILQNVFGNGSRQSITIKGTGPPSQFVNDDQTSFGGRPQNGPRLEHFGHEGTDPPFLQIARSHPRQERMAEIDGGRIAGDVGTNLGHANNGTQGSDVGRFAPHVWTGDDAKVGGSKFQGNVVGDEFDILLQFDAGMTGSLELS